MRTALKPPPGSSVRPLRRLRTLTAAVLASTTASIALIAPTSTAVAADGPAPDPTEQRILTNLHTDAVSTFLDDGALTLGTKADVPEGHGTRFDPDEVLFHVDESSKQTIPAGYDFIAPAGSQAWIAPEANPSSNGSYTQLWPGFSTESIAPGSIEGDTTTFRLVNMEAPEGGELEVWRGSDFDVVRMWSTDEGIDSFSIGNTHMHANWAFTKAGVYRLTVEGSVVIDGQTQTDTAVYTFIAGPLPEQATTSLDVHAHGDTTFSVGGSVELHASVTPATAEGYVEFRDNGTVVGHEEVIDGEASFEVTGLAVGTHSLTSHFVPKVANFATVSDADPVTVTVTGESGAEFAVTGVKDSYAIGDDLVAEAVGATLAEGQMFRWLIRPRGWDVTGTNIQTSTSPTFQLSEADTLLDYTSRTLNASDDGYEISVTVRQCANESCRSGEVVSQTAWQPISVVTEGEPPVLTQVSGPSVAYPGDRFRFQASTSELAEGESLEFVYRYSSVGPWRTGNVRVGGPGWVGTDVTQIDPATVEVLRTGTNAVSNGGFETAVRVLRDGVPVRQSEPVTSPPYANFELLPTGLQPLYLEGASAELSAEIYPVREGDQFTYRWQFSKEANFLDNNPTTTIWGTSTTPSISKVVTVAEHNEGYLRIQVLTPDGTVAFNQNVGRVYVTDDPNEQLFFFEALSAHYHQGYEVNLNLTVTPDVSDGDQINWEWKWPGGEWTTFPGPIGKSHTLIAEQALAGVQVRATLDFADARESVVAEPVTIAHDDHGAAARQQPTIIGQTSATEGDTVTLTRELPENGQTVLTDHRWEKKNAGSEEWSVIEGQTGAELSFTAALADDGAEYRVSLLKPNGEIGYGPSPAVTLAVAEGAFEATVPAAPAKPSAAVDGSSVTVSWAAPHDGGSPITGYTVSLTPESDETNAENASFRVVRFAAFAAADASETISTDAAADATSVTFSDVPEGSWVATVVAKNAVGSSAASPASDAVTVKAAEGEPTPTPTPGTQTPGTQTPGTQTPGTEPSTGSSTAGAATPDTATKAALPSTGVTTSRSAIVAALGLLLGGAALLVMGRRRTAASGQGPEPID